MTQATQPSDGFTDRSLATPLTKALRMLRALAGERSRYFFGDGYPRTADLRQDARAALRVFEEFAHERAAQPPGTSTIDMVLFCPACGEQHIDSPAPDRGWTNPPHRSHLCLSCGHIWRPAAIATQGVKALPESGKCDSPAPLALRRHYYSFAFREGNTLSSICVGFSDKAVTLARIQTARDGAGMGANSPLMGPFYLGFMSEEEFHGTRSGPEGE
jgi:hypothetical protein